MKTTLSILAAVAALVLPAQLRAAEVPVTVTITRVRNISAGDAFGGAPDFYAKIWIDGAVLRTPTVFNSHGFTSPAGWTFTRRVSRAKRGGLAPVRIELRDFDAPLPDPLVDIDVAGCPSSDPFGCAEVSTGPQPVDSFGIDVNLNLFDGSWTPQNPAGDSSLGPATPGITQMACTTGAGENVANICFTITVGAPTSETLTVGKTADSDRAFCAPRDCSLREAIALAESGDTVALPASATPYLLTLPGSAFPVPDPSEPWRESGSHLRIRQPLLIISGPEKGGTAVIRQTQPDSRVFDVYGGATLQMSRVTVTGGGAGNNSTAYLNHIHGGGIHNHGTIELTHVTITGNRALEPSDAFGGGGGGGIYNARDTKAKLTNVTIAGNTTGVNGLGGGIAGPGEFTLRNTVIANNTVAGTAGFSNCGLGGGVGVGVGTAMKIIDEGGNLQFPGSDCGRWVTFTSPRTGTTHTFWWPFFPTALMDPLLPLDARRTVFFPARGGPAVDTGVPGCGPTDQAGQPAPRDGNADGVVACDSGAIEAQ